MDTQCLMQPERQLKSHGQINRAAILVIWMFVAFYFHLTGNSLFIISICFCSLVLLNIDYAIGTIILCYALIPSDYINYMFVPSPFGNFPLYVLLIIAFLMIEFLNTIFFKKNFQISRPSFKITQSFMLLIIAILVTALFNGLSKEMISNTIKFMVQLMGVGSLVLIKNINRKEIDKILLFCICVAISVSFITVIEVIGKVNIYNFYGSQYYSEWFDYMSSINGLGSWRAKSTMGNPLVLSSYLVLAIPIIEYFRQKGFNTFWIVLFVASISVGIILSGSRSACLALLIYFSYIVMKSKMRQKIIILILSAAALVLILYKIDFSLLLERISRAGSDGSLSDRQSAYGVFLNVIGLNIFTGIGLGNTYTALAGMVGGNNTFDNGILELLYAIGILGVIPIVYLLITLQFVNNKGQQTYRYNMIINRLMIVILYLSFFLNVTKYQSLWGVFWLYIFLLYKLKTKSETNKQMTSSFES